MESSNHFPSPPSATTPRMWSGAYHPLPASNPPPGGFMPAIAKEEFRLDVDGHFPQMMASGVLHFKNGNRTHWIAKLVAETNVSWQGTIWYPSEKPTDFPFQFIKIVYSSPSTGSTDPTLHAHFKAWGITTRKQSFIRVSPHFHKVEFEFIREDTVQPVLSIQTDAHPRWTNPNHPSESIHIDTVFERAGFEVSHSPHSGVTAIPTSTKLHCWTNAELHDALVHYWSRYSEEPQWALWVLFAEKHKEGFHGVMFDQCGPLQRRAAAVFNHEGLFQNVSSLSTRWLKFFITCHEMGHCFNLAHTKEKNQYAAWLPDLQENLGSLSFMNQYLFYRQRDRFFQNFNFRFSNSELVFLRHAPEDFVKMGGASFTKNHGLSPSSPNESTPDGWEARLLPAKESCCFKFLEPIHLELTLTSASLHHREIDANILKNPHHTKVFIQKGDHAPFLHQQSILPTFPSASHTLTPGGSLYHSFLISAGHKGWTLAEPGFYCAWAVIEFDSKTILFTPPCCFNVAPPSGQYLESIASSWFTDEISTILTMGGSQLLQSGLATIRETCLRLPDHAISILGNLLLGQIRMDDYLLMESSPYAPPTLQTVPANHEEAWSHLSMGFLNRLETAVQILGPVSTCHHLNPITDWLAQNQLLSKSIYYQERFLHLVSSLRKPIYTDLIATIRAKKLAYQSLMPS